MLVCTTKIYFILLQLKNKWIWKKRKKNKRKTPIVTEQQNEKYVQIKRISENIIIFALIIIFKGTKEQKTKSTHIYTLKFVLQNCVKLSLFFILSNLMVIFNFAVKRLYCRYPIYWEIKIAKQKEIERESLHTNSDSHQVTII